MLLALQFIAEHIAGEQRGHALHARVLHGEAHGLRAHLPQAVRAGFGNGDLPDADDADGADAHAVGAPMMASPRFTPHIITSATTMNIGATIMMLL